MYSIAVVIPNHKRPNLLERLLTSIFATTFPESLIGIWVVENGGKAGAEDICQRFNTRFPVHYCYSEMANLSNARNVGAQNAKADFIIFFDDDLRCDNNTLVAYDASIQQYGHSCFYGGPLGIDYEEKPSEWLMKYLPCSVQGLDEGSEHMLFDKPVFLGGNHAVARDKLLQIGGYDLHSAGGEGEESAMGEEYRLQQRLLDDGLKGSYNPNANVWHFVPKERCSETWAHQRFYRSGLTLGIFDSKKGADSSAVFLGAPRWIWKQYWLLRLKRFFSKLTNAEKYENLFKMKHEAARLKGIIDGYRLERDKQKNTYNQ